MERLSFPLLFHCSHLLKENQGNKVLWSLLGVKIPEICFRILYLDMPCQKKQKNHTHFLKTGPTTTSQQRTPRFRESNVFLLIVIHQL